MCAPALSQLSAFKGPKSRKYTHVGYRNKNRKLGNVLTTKEEEEEEEEEEDEHR